MLLKQRGVVSLEKILVDLLPDEKNKMIERTGRRTVPQIFIGDVYVGGCDDLYELDHKGELVKLLSGD
jgi:glutaredoxin 3